jgi:hypothetical protein
MDSMVSPLKRVNPAKALESLGVPFGQGFLLGRVSRFIYRRTKDPWELGIIG